MQMHFSKPAVTFRAPTENVVVGKSPKDVMSPRQPLVLSPLQISEFSPRINNDKMMRTFNSESSSNSMLGNTIVPKAMTNRKLVEDNNMAIYRKPMSFTSSMGDFIKVARGETDEVMKEPVKLRRGASSNMSESSLGRD